MTTIDPTTLAATRTRPSLFARIWAAIEAARLRQARHRILVELSRHDAHLLRDMGIDPADVADALNRRSLSVLFQPVRAPYQPEDDRPA